MGIHILVNLYTEMAPRAMKPSAKFQNNSITLNLDLMASSFRDILQ